MLTTRSRFLVMTACAALATGVVAGPAGAWAGHTRNATSLSAGHSSGVLPDGGVHPNVSTPYGAGYFSYPGTGNVDSASVTFVMPATWSCHRTTDKEWLSPGIWVYDSGGNLSQFSGVEFNCNEGSLFTGDVMCVDSYSVCDDTMVVNPGDRVVASLSESSSSTVAAVHDLTTGARMQISGGPAAGDSTVFIGDAGPSIASGGTVTKVPTFTKVSYSLALVNGQYLGDWSPTRYNLATNGSLVQETTGALVNHGLGFTTRFNHN